MDRFISFLHENWLELTSTELAAYSLWRLNWIHRFIEGNGRTARATCYYVLCTREGRFLSGKKIVPERIRENRDAYIEALVAADRAWEFGNYDLGRLEAYLAQLLTEQLLDAEREAEQ